MSVEERWEHFFKPEVRSAGRELLAKDAVFLKRGSDTQVDASIRGTTPTKVAFRTESIENKTFSANCSCPASKKGQFCKHIWATLLLVETNSPDFLDSKEVIEKFDSTVSSQSPASQEEVSSPSENRSPSKTQIEYQQKQAEYRKQAYQKQKQRMKDFKSNKSSAKTSKTSRLTVTLPDNVQAAVTYFAENGFPMEAPFNAESVHQAKRTLSRVFHPDRGGTHEEVLELLGHAEILLDYI